MEWIDREMPGILLFPGPEVVSFTVVIPGIAFSCGALFTLKTQIAVALGVTTFILTCCAYVVIVSMLILKGAQDPSKGRFIVEKDQFGNPHDTVSVAFIPGNNMIAYVGQRICRKYTYLTFRLHYVSTQERGKEKERIVSTISTECFLETSRAKLKPKRTGLIM